MCSQGAQTGFAPLTRSRSSTQPASRSRTSRSARRSTSAGGREMSTLRSSPSEVDPCALLCLLLVALLRGGGAMPVMLFLLLALLRLLGGRTVVRRQWPAVGERHVVQVVGLASLPVRAHVRNHGDPVGRTDQGHELSLARGIACPAQIWADSPAAGLAHLDREVVVVLSQALRNEPVEIVGALGKKQELRGQRGLGVL